MKLRLFTSIFLMPALSSVLSFTQGQTPRLIIQNGHHGGVQKVAFTPDGKILVSLGSEGKIKLWDADTGRLLYDIQDAKDFHSFAINEDGSVLATSQTKGPYYDYSTGASVIKLWNLKSRVLINEFAGHGLQLAFSPDGKTISTGGTSIAVFEVATGRQKLSINNEGGLISGLAFTSKGDSLISTNNIGIVDCFKVSNGERFNRIRDNQEAIQSFALSPDDKLIFYATNSRMTLRDLNSGQIVFTQEAENYQPFFNSGQQNYFMAVAFSPDGKYLATAHVGGNVNILDARTGKVLRKIQTHQDRLVTLAFAPRTTIIASAGILTSSDNKTTNVATIKLADAATGNIVRDLGGFLPSIAAIALSPDETTLYASKNDFGNPEGNGKIDIWGLRNNNKLTSIRADKDAVTRIAISSDGKKMATSGYGRTAKIWDLKTGNSRLEVDGALAAAFGPADILAIGFESVVGTAETTRTPDIEIRDLNAGTPGKHIKRDGSPAYGLFFSADGKLLIVSAGSRIEIRQAETGDLRKELEALSSSTFAAALSSDGNILASGGSNGAGDASEKGVVQLWDAHTWEPRPPMFDDSGWIRALAFNSNGTILASGGDGKDLILWNAKTGKKIQTFDDGGITSIAFSKNDKFLITGGVGGIRIFKHQSANADASVYQELCQLFSLNDGTWVVAAADGRFDTNSLEVIKGLHWIMPDDPLRPLPLEIFMRDYYEPRLLSRLLDCNSQNNCQREFVPLPSLAELNRAQPLIRNITVRARNDTSELVDVKVEVSSTAGHCFKDSKEQPCESGVYDLRLYRDRQLVGQAPERERTRSGTIPVRASNWRDQLREWRETSAVKTKYGKLVRAATGPQEITFEGIQLPRRAEKSEIEFTAYAFNEDRVKTTASEPTVYRLPPRRGEVQQRAYVITVGVDWTSADWRLGFAPKGAAELEQLLKQKFQDQRYDVVTVQLLSAYKEDSADLVNLATKENLRTVLNILAGASVPVVDREKIPNEKQLKRATPDDAVVLYIASHGYADPVGKFYVIPSNNGEPGVSEQSLSRCLKKSQIECEAEQMFLQRSISSDELAQWLAMVDADEMVLILDSCHSAAVSGPDFKPGPMGDSGFGQLSYDKGMLVLAATQAENVAWGTLDLGDRSLLTYALTQQRTPGQGFDLRQWVSQAEKQVPELYEKFVKTEPSSSSKQRPDQEPTLFDFSKKGLH